MREKSRFISMLLIVIALPTFLFASGWTQKKGRGFYKIGFRFIRANEFYEPNGNKISIPTLGDNTLSFYGEHGLTDRITLVAYIPFYKRITLNRQVGQESGFVYFEGDAISGIADADVGFRFGLRQDGSTVLSLGFMFGLPLGDDQQANGLLTSDGEFNQFVSLQIGHSFYPTPVYFAAEAGFNNRSKGYSDEFRYGFELGYQIKQRLTFILRATGVQSLKNGNDSVMGGMGGLFANNQSFLAYGPELVYTMNDKLGISFGVDSAIFAENTLSAAVFSFGLFLKR